MHLQNGTWDGRDGCNNPQVHVMLWVENDCDYSQMVATLASGWIYVVFDVMNCHHL